MIRRSLYQTIVRAMSHSKTVLNISISFERKRRRV